MMYSTVYLQGTCIYNLLSTRLLRDSKDNNKNMYIKEKRYQRQLQVLNKYILVAIRM